MSCGLQLLDHALSLRSDELGAANSNREAGYLSDCRLHGIDVRVGRDPGITAGELFPRVKGAFEFAHLGHHGVEVGFLAKIHSPHFLVIPAEGLLEASTRREPRVTLVQSRGQFLRDLWERCNTFVSASGQR